MYNNEIKTNINRGDIFLYNFGEATGSIQGGIRAAVVVSNNICNKYSPVILISPITSRIEGKAQMPTHVVVDHRDCGLLRESQILCEQIFPISKNKLGKYIGTLNLLDMKKLNSALEVSIGVGKDGEKFKNEEIKEINKKVETIKELDSLIKNWLSKNKAVDLIYEFIEERNARLNEMKIYCEKIGLDYREFYNDEIMSQRKKIS